MTNMLLSQVETQNISAVIEADIKHYVTECGLLKSWSTSQMVRAIIHRWISEGSPGLSAGARPFPQYKPAKGTKK